jgi:23S rRNA (uracil1939-C5)-methyltransferase
MRFARIASRVVRPRQHRTMGSSGGGGGGGSCGGEIVTIERLDMASGCGVTYVPDLSSGEKRIKRVDVPNSVPGDTLALRPMPSLLPSEGKRNKKKNWRKRRKRGRNDRWFYGHIDHLLEPASPHRVAPICPLSEHCGGCTFQHVAYETQLVAKDEHLRQLLIQAADKHDAAPWLLPPALDIRPIIGCDGGIWNYRNKTEFTFSTREWRIKDRAMDEDASAGEHGTIIANAGAVGFHPSRKTNSTAARWHNKIVRVDNCYLQPDICNDVLNFIWEGVGRHGIPLYDQENHCGFIKHLILRTSHNNDDENDRKRELFVDFRTGVGTDVDHDKMKMLSGELVQHFLDSSSQDAYQLVGVAASVDAAALRHEVRRRRKEQEKEEGGKGDSAEQVRAPDIDDGLPRILHGRSHFFETIQNLEFRVSYSSFFQPNPRQSERLFHEAAKLINLDGTQVLFDLFCGSGVVGLCLASQGRAKALVGVVLNQDAVEDAKYNAQKNGMDDMADFLAVDLTRKDIGEKLSNLPEPDIIVVDPPRAGLNQRLIRMISSLAPDEVCYISCNPETLVRDLTVFSAEGYFPITLQPVDMLPHTNHLESICVLRRKSSSY